jgi:hypothetical protein
MISCKNTLTPRKKLTQKNPPINQQKREEKEERKTMMAPSNANEETEEERKSCWTCIEWFLRKKRSFLK